MLSRECLFCFLCSSCLTIFHLFSCRDLSILMLTGLYDTHTWKFPPRFTVKGVKTLCVQLHGSLNESSLEHLMGSLISFPGNEVQVRSWIFLTDMKYDTFIMQVENHGPLQLHYHLKIPASMCRMQWGVKIYDWVKQLCSFGMRAFPCVIVPCTNQMISIILNYIHWPLKTFLTSW